MTRRQLNSAAVAKLLHVDRSYISRWLRKQRGTGSTSGEKGGLSVGVMFRMMKELDFDADTLFYADPPAEFRRAYLPQGFGPEDPEPASPTPPQTTGPARAGEEAERRDKKAR
jgi:hypothetical protein